MIKPAPFSVPMGICKNNGVRLDMKATCLLPPATLRTMEAQLLFDLARSDIQNGSFDRFQSVITQTTGASIVRDCGTLPENCGTHHFSEGNKKPRNSLSYGVFKSGGRGRNRTGVGGFAIHCITILLLGLKHLMSCSTTSNAYKLGVRFAI